jgi:hypothetical protein
MNLPNEYYFVFEIHTLFEPGDHPETWKGLQYGVYSGHVCLASTPQKPVYGQHTLAFISTVKYASLCGEAKPWIDQKK